MRIVISKALENGKYSTEESFDLSEPRAVDFSALAEDFPDTNVTVFTDSLMESAGMGDANPTLRRDRKNPLRLWLPRQKSSKPLPSKY